MMPSTMRYLLRGVAIIATFAIAAPVWAQTAAPMTAPHKRIYVHHHVWHHRGHHVYHRASPNNIANQLNAEELERLSSSSASGMEESHGGPYGEWKPTGGSRGGPYGQPTPTFGMRGAWQSSASSHPPNEMGQH